MTDDSDDISSAAPGGSLAAQMAMSAPHGAASEAYLREQTELARLQKQNLVEQNAFELSHLRWRRFNDQMKGALQIMMVLVGLGIVIAIAASVWSAAHDDSLIIDAFKVPPDMAAQGLTGDVVASQLLDRLSAMQVQTDSSRAPSTYAGNTSGDIKVEIPNTGVSIGEAYRYLAGWLGHQTHISGEIFHTSDGIALTARVGGDAGVTFEGHEADLAKLTQKAAESVYHQTQPYRYAIFVASTDTGPDSLARQDALLGELALSGPDSEKPWAYMVWCYVSLAHGDIPEALYRARKAVALSPAFPDAILTLANIEEVAGHDAASLDALRRALKALDGPGVKMIVPRVAAVYRSEIPASVAEDGGDWRGALAQYARVGALADFEGLHWNADYMTAADLALDHDVSAARRVRGVGSDAGMFLRMHQGFGWQLVNVSWPGYIEHAELGDWQGARADLEAVLATRPSPSLAATASFPNQTWPWLALAMAHTGDARKAHALIDKTPPDCYLCQRVRAEIDAAQMNWQGAAYWFARAVNQAPSLPFAYAEWGEMLLHEGKYDAAVAKFESAHKIGPHFADPLEMWGEALIAKNRSDLALAKFEEANKYAPNWGRLHFKWGEALWWSGRRDEAKKQFAVASRLDLTPSETSELAKVSHG